MALRDAKRSLRIIIPGGSGQVGTVLANYFHWQGDSVVVLSRRIFQAPWRVVSLPNLPASLVLSRSLLFQFTA
jgi:hypothetical protein